MINSGQQVYQLANVPAQQFPHEGAYSLHVTVIQPCLRMCVAYFCYLSAERATLLALLLLQRQIAVLSQRRN